MSNHRAIWSHDSHKLQATFLSSHVVGVGNEGQHFTEQHQIYHNNHLLFFLPSTIPPRPPSNKALSPAQCPAVRLVVLNCALAPMGLIPLTPRGLMPLTPREVIPLTQSELIPLTQSELIALIQSELIPLTQRELIALTPGGRRAYAIVAWSILRLAVPWRRSIKRLVWIFGSSLRSHALESSRLLCRGDIQG
jgi:hypothetical protein